MASQSCVCSQCGLEGPVFMLGVHMERCVTLAQPQSNKAYLEPRVPLLRLASSYRGSQALQEALLRDAKVYPSFIPTRGDGNCFYRAFLYLLMRQLLACDDATTRRSLLQPLLAYARTPTEQAAVARLLGEPADLVLGDAKAHEVVCDPSVSNFCVSLLRQLVAKQLREDPAFGRLVAVTLEQDEEAVETVIRKHVLPMGEDAQEPFIAALSIAMSCRLQVEWRRRDLVKSQLYPDQDGSPSRTHLGAVLFRDGHYDVMCARTEYEGMAQHWVKVDKAEKQALYLPQSCSPTDLNRVLCSLLGHPLFMVEKCDGFFRVTTETTDESPPAPMRRWATNSLRLIFDLQHGKKLFQAGTSVRVPGCICSACPFPGKWCQEGLKMLDELKCPESFWWCVISSDDIPIWDVPLYWLE